MGQCQFQPEHHFHAHRAPWAPCFIRRPGNTNTAPVQTARSSVGSPFLFHGQYFDYDTGLLYLRSRFYDPFSGMFLEPDPLGYEDSVNPYAGFGNNPASLCDPSGTRPVRVKSCGRAPGRSLASAGLTDMEIDAINNVLQKRGENIKISIRKFVKKDENGEIIKESTMWRQLAAENGVMQKGCTTKAKCGFACTGTDQHGRTVVSDLDALHVEINGQMASVPEIRKLFGDINREYRTIFRQKYPEGTIPRDALQSAVPARGAGPPGHAVGPEGRARASTPPARLTCITSAKSGIRANAL